MDLGLLFSGGKDSSLAALVLEPLYDVTLVCAHFDVTDAADLAGETADALGFPFTAVELERAVAEEAVAQMVEDGVPRNGIQLVHEAAIERVAAEFDVVADGTRRDDRVPTVSRARAQSIEDRHGVEYVAPLSGFGRAAVDDLVERRLEVVSGPSEDLAKGDYEAELRALLAEAHGESRVAEVFPEHVQTRVTGRRDSPAQE